MNRREPPAPSKPSAFYRITTLLNVLVWRMPLPRRVLVLLSNVVYRNPPMPAEVVLGVLACFEDAGVPCWVTGGWGVDVLAGMPSRIHRDLDLVVGGEDTRRALDVLAGLGYREWYRAESDQLMESSVVLRDQELGGRAIDLHSVDLPDPRVEFAVGMLEGQEVPCTSLAWQLRAHTGYRRRRRDRADFELLRRLQG